MTIYVYFPEEIREGPRLVTCFKHSPGIGIHIRLVLESHSATQHPQSNVGPYLLGRPESQLLHSNLGGTMPTDRS